MMAPLQRTIYRSIVAARNLRRVSASSRIRGPLGAHFSSTATCSSIDVVSNRGFSSLLQEDYDANLPEFSHPTTSASVSNDGTRVVVSFNDEDQSTFHAPWLWSNDPTWIHPTSGQRLRTPGGYSSDFRIKSAEIVDSANETNVGKSVLPFPPPPRGSSHPVGNVYESPIKEQTTTGAQCLRVTWESSLDNDESSASYYDVGWLRQWRYDSDAIESRRAASKISPLHALQSDGKIPTFDYSDMEADSNEFAFQLLAAIVESGAALVQNAPTNVSNSNPPVAKLGRLLGGSLSHGALYGDTFDVKSVPDANNIAYTSVPLGPHQDLAYYESKPGLQLLHCLSNEGVEGGESVLVDAMAAAEELCRIAPEHFRTLTKCSATFVKQRDGADMMYRRPHIVVDDCGDVVSVNWSPPFEGPLSVSPELVEKYYPAYGVFERMLDNSLADNYGDKSDPELAILLREYAEKYTWQRRLESGDILVFNNLRMLHGRRGFEFKGDTGGRHLQGCYTNIDDTLNRYRVLSRERSDIASMRNAGNGTCGMP